MHIEPITLHNRRYYVCYGHVGRVYVNITGHTPMYALNNALRRIFEHKG